MEEEVTVEEEEEVEENGDDDDDDDGDDHVNKHFIFSIICEYNLATIFLFLSCKCIECL